MEINRYLKELGLDWCDLPGNYDGKLHNCGIKKLENSAAADPRNKIDDEGFCEYEFFSLDYSMALYIYPRLCKFRDEYAKYGTPGCLCYDENEKQLPSEESSKRWMEILDKIIWSFKSTIIEPTWNTIEELQEINAKIDEGLHLFADYFQYLWW